MLFYVDRLLLPIDTLRTVVNMAYNVEGNCRHGSKLTWLHHGLCEVYNKSSADGNFFRQLLRRLR